MSCGGPLSAVMMVAGSGLLSGTGLNVNSALTSNLGSFSSLPVVSQFSNVVTSATGVLGSSTLSSLRTLGAGVFPALTNAIPSSVTGVLGSTANGGLTGLIGNTASGMLGGGNTGAFSQILGSTQGWASSANQFLNSAVNATSPIAKSTFGSLTGGMDNTITGSFSQLTPAIGSFGKDLGMTGSLINMSDLSNLGNPSSLIKNLASAGGITPAIQSTLTKIGISPNVTSFATGNFTLTDTANKMLYSELTKITGPELNQITGILNVKTPGINTAADLLNPVKILPTSYPALTTPTPDGLRAIYATTSGAVNTNLSKIFSSQPAPPYTGDDPIVKSRLGIV